VALPFLTGLAVDAGAALIPTMAATLPAAEPTALAALVSPFSFDFDFDGIAIYLTIVLQLLATVRIMIE
jgi:hypothetical protein